MIPHGVDVFVALEPIDLRWSFDRLACLAEEHMGRQARCGALFVFFGKRRTALKILFFDGSGLCVFYKRLDRGTFRLPEALRPGDKTIVVEERVLDELLDGIALETKPVQRRGKRRASLH